MIFVAIDRFPFLISNKAPQSPGRSQTRETLENQVDPRDNSLVITGYGWVDGLQAARIR
jgi:hypothetical protein